MRSSPVYVTVERWPQTPVDRPTLTIILPLYNCASHLHKCFELLAETALPSTELIIVDDGSTDTTLAAACELSAPFPRVRVMAARQNGGVAPARQAALVEAAGTYVWFLDWDDDWDPSIMTEMMAKARVHDADMVVCGATRNNTPTSSGVRIDGPETEIILTGTEAFDRVLTGEIRGYLWNKLIRRDIAQQLEFPAMSSLSDFAGLVPVIARAECIVAMPTILYRHIVRSGSITNSTPVIENWFTSRSVVRSVAAGLDRRGGENVGLLLYDFRFVHLSAVNTVLRLRGSSELFRATVDRVTREVRSRHIVRVARVDPGLALRVAVVKLSGRQYRYIYALSVKVRSSLGGAR